MTTALRQEGRCKRMVLLVCRTVLGGVFIAAALSKVAAPYDFARAVYQYHLLPESTINIVAVFLPWLELATGCAVLFVGRLRDAAAVMIGIMLLAFAVAIAMNLYRGIEAPCGCFAVLGRKPAGWGHLVADIVLAIIAFGIAFDQRIRRCN